jgi:hypothetical protein
MRLNLMIDLIINKQAHGVMLKYVTDSVMSVIRQLSACDAGQFQSTSAYRLSGPAIAYSEANLQHSPHHQHLKIAR